jgi:hypothetical protein
MRVFVEANRNFTEEIRYIFRTLAHNRFALQFVDSLNEADVSAGASSTFDFQIAEDFFGMLEKKIFRHDEVFRNDCLVRTSAGIPDYLSSAFYMINSLQEYNDTDVDEIGRFRYRNSYQHKFGNVDTNLVGGCFQKILEHPRLTQLKTKPSKSRVFLSHDIDSINGAVTQDSFFLMKKGNPAPILGLIMNAALQRPDWLNMDKIMKIEDEYSLKSTFFWLVNKGRLNKREVNSDYNIRSKNIRGALKSIHEHGWENGLHKSISSNTYAEEIAKLDLKPIANRNHYLKFKLPDLYNDIEASGLQMDASLGFAEVMGFRNSYGLPFHPFNMKERKPHSFVEVPLNVMDGTLKQYLGVPLEETAKQIIGFLEKNKEDCLISLLWHNTYFTDYKFKGYVKVYQEIMKYIHEKQLRGINPTEIVSEFGWKK